MDNQLIPRKLTEAAQLKLAIQMSQYNNLDRLILTQRNNQFKLDEAVYLDIENEIADYKVMAKVLEKAIKFSLH